MRTRVGDVMVDVQAAPAIIDFNEILGATEVVWDECTYEAPRKLCDGLEHTIESVPWIDRATEDLRKQRGFCLRLHGDIVIIRLESDGADLYRYHRENGASRQVAAEAVACHRRAVLDQLVEWYEAGWDRYGVRCLFKVLGKEYNDSLWGIDGRDYVESECAVSVALEVAAQLESDGYTVVNKPSKQKRYRHGRINEQNWQ